MKSCRTIEIRTPIRALLFACGLSAGLGAVTETQAADDALLQPTPLILKDGRIANVSVHTLAFAAGQSALGPANTQRLSSLTSEMATDCFLTAQVIGHVGATEVGGDTLNAHRLARARADAVQASLIAGGLPAKAIASVWDWQFMVREPRATLWVFRLTPGEDCDGRPLDLAAPALIARAELPPAPAPAPGRDMRPASAPGGEPQPRPAPSDEPRADRVASAVQDRGTTQSAPAAPDLPLAAVGVQAAEPPATVAAVPAGASRTPAEVPRVIQALPAVSPSTAKAPPGTPEPRPAAAAAEAKPATSTPPEVVAALPEDAAPAQVAPAAEKGPAAVEAKPEALVITFPTNSSYFPPGTSAQLRSLTQKLGRDQRYQVVLEASVSGIDKVVGAESPEEAAQYNKWLADRRLDRVRDWLAQHDAGGALVIKPEYRANDESRQVVVRITPTG